MSLPCELTISSASEEDNGGGMRMNLMPNVRVGNTLCVSGDGDRHDRGG